ncbi:protein kinase [Gregarina niphandrodes]|uniref:non-specific serine/threonine protein kinase n=1 Tax=Gregarina niphandrodes TaxID=110365 RepID=A0A023AXG4_GRENI|nr:protein kinase [Gregarina niphandrodes]EZG43322.1 protein kinase [Gregarina niphandrodes]|eukprot:XP_011133420.1 protein kinase [Gregarina niphandrodes]
MGNSCVRGTQVTTKYVMGHTLGVGSFGQVKLITSRTTGERYACKMVKKKTGGRIAIEDMFRNENEILHRLSHPHIVKIIETYEDKTYYYAVLELCDGGELFSKIVSRRHLKERDARYVCKQILSTLAYLHGQGVVHRDIKAENFLIRKPVVDLCDSDIVLIDFGMSASLKSGREYLKHVCGSPHYVAPELIRKRYREQVDMWAFGIVVYLMMYGQYPFEGPTQKDIAQKVLRQEPDYNPRRRRISRTAIDFIRKCLVKNPNDRLTAEAALKHPWIVQNEQLIAPQQLGVALTTNQRDKDMVQETRRDDILRRQREAVLMAQTSPLTLVAAQTAMTTRVTSPSTVSHVTPMTAQAGQPDAERYLCRTNSLFTPSSVITSLASTPPPGRSTQAFGARYQPDGAKTGPDVEGSGDSGILLLGSEEVDSPDNSMPRSNGSEDAGSDDGSDDDGSDDDGSDDDGLGGDGVDDDGQSSDEESGKREQSGKHSDPGYGADGYQSDSDDDIPSHYRSINIQRFDSRRSFLSRSGGTPRYQRARQKFKDLTKTGEYRRQFK